jgi:branched-chain amino acid transport system permease protein
MITLLNIMVDGISYGMVLFIISVGLSITLGLMRFINLVHGAFAMTGGYLAAWLVRVQGMNFWLGLTLATVATALLAAALEAMVLKRLYRRSELDQVLFTLGMTFVFVAIANFLFGPQVQLLPIPAALATPFDLGFRTLPAHRLVVLLAGVLIAVFSWTVLVKTRFGIWLRAAVDNPDMAASLGIPIRRVYAWTFAFGAGMAAIGGILGAELLPLEPYYAMKYMVLVLGVVAVGGMGGVFGSLAAGLTLGIAEAAGKYLASSYGNFFFFGTMMILLLLRPRGLLQK